jgi:hypothetical protein
MIGYIVGTLHDQLQTAGMIGRITALFLFSYSAIHREDLMHIDGVLINIISVFEILKLVTGLSPVQS